MRKISLFLFTLAFTGCTTEYDFDSIDPELMNSDIDVIVNSGISFGEDPNETSNSEEQTDVTVPCGTNEHRLVDNDQDGYGDPDNYIIADVCDEWEEGYVHWIEGYDDCDDSDPDVHPGAIERCDFIDNDCDGLSEVHDPDAINFIYHDDDDGDGIGGNFADGAGGGCSMSGSIPPGHARSGGDCDDSDPDVHPGAFEVVDGVDNDCDGVIE